MIIAETPSLGNFDFAQCCIAERNDTKRARAVARGNRGRNVAQLFLKTARLVSLARVSRQQRKPGVTQTQRANHQEGVAAPAQYSPVRAARAYSDS